MHNQPHTQPLTPEAMFERAVNLAQQGHRQPAYHLFKQVSQTQLGVWNPNIWLWIATLTTDFKEGEAALQKAAELGPLHPDLAKARQDFAARKRITLRRRRIGFFGMVASFGVLGFLMACVTDVFPTVGSLPGIYMRQFMEKGSAVGYSWLAIVFCIGFTVYYLSHRAFQKSWISPLFILGLLGAIGLNSVIMVSSIRQAEVYHNKMQYNGAVYHLESVRFGFGFRSYNEERLIRVYKCDPSGLVCSKYYSSTYNLASINYSYTHQNEFKLSYDADNGLHIVDKEGQPTGIRL